MECLIITIYDPLMLTNFFMVTISKYKTFVCICRGFLGIGDWRLGTGDWRLGIDGRRSVTQQCHMGIGDWC